MHFLFYTQAILVQTMLKSLRIASMTLAILILNFCDVDVSRHIGTDTGSERDISPQIQIFAEETICRVYQKFGHIILGIL